MTSAQGLAVAFILGGVHWAPAGAQEIGRLFHSVEQRNTLDALRKTKRQQKPPASQPSISSQPAHLDGYVLRPDGKSVVWVNGQIGVRR